MMAPNLSKVKQFSSQNMDAYLTLYTQQVNELFFF